jgi:hypothetical protein
MEGGTGFSLARPPLTSTFVELKANSSELLKSQLDMLAKAIKEMAKRMRKKAEPPSRRAQMSGRQCVPSLLFNQPAKIQSTNGPTRHDEDPPRKEPCLLAVDLLSKLSAVSAFPLYRDNKDILWA